MDYNMKEVVTRYLLLRKSLGRIIYMSKMRFS